MTVLTVKDAWDRLTTVNERKSDRRFIYMISIGNWRRAWRKAVANGDCNAMDDLDRSYEQLHAL